MPLRSLWHLPPLQLRSEHVEGGSGCCSCSSCCRRCYSSMYIIMHRRARCMCLVLLLEFLLFSFASAVPSSKEHVDQIAPVDDSSRRIAAQLHSTSNDYPALQEAYFLPKDRLFPEVVQNSASRYSITGLRNLVRRFIAAVVTTHQIQLGIEGNMNSWLVGTSLDDHQKWQLLGSREEACDVASSSSGYSRRLLLRGPRRRNRRSSSPRHVWVLNQQHQHKRRRVMEEASTSPGGQQTQQVVLGPPAPPGLVHNEKQDWNQDYAEPDVHPPSSN